MGLVEDTALIAAPNEFVREYLDSKLRPYLALVLGEEIGRDVQIAVTVQGAPTRLPLTTRSRTTTRARSTSSPRRSPATTGCFGGRPRPVRRPVTP